MPIYFPCTLVIPLGILKQTKRIQRCLWRGNSDTLRQSLASWDLLCLPKNKGGLDVLNLRVQNEALLMKFLHKFYNHLDNPWVHLIWDSYYDTSVPHTTSLFGSFWWRDVFKLAHKYCHLASPKLGDGRSILFWTDSCVIELKGSSIRIMFPRLFSFVIDGQLLVSEVLSQELLSSWRLPLFTQAFNEMECL